MGTNRHWQVEQKVYQVHPAYDAERKFTGWAVRETHISKIFTLEKDGTSYDLPCTAGWPFPDPNTLFTTEDEALSCMEERNSAGMPPFTALRDLPATDCPYCEEA